jgi:hypothetical protein
LIHDPCRAGSSQKSRAIRSGITAALTGPDMCACRAIAHLAVRLSRNALRGRSFSASGRRGCTDEMRLAALPNA